MNPLVLGILLIAVLIFCIYMEERFLSDNPQFIYTLEKITHSMASGRRYYGFIDVECFEPDGELNQEKMFPSFVDDVYEPVTNTDSLKMLRGAYNKIKQVEWEKDQKKFSEVKKKKQKALKKFLV
jgi:hypothetical protein